MTTRPNRNRDRPFIEIARHFRAARVLVDWTQHDLCAATGFTQDTISRFERGFRIKAETVEAIVKAFEKAGVEFIYTKTTVRGVTYKDIDGGKNVVQKNHNSGSSSWRARRQNELDRAKSEGRGKTPRKPPRVRKRGRQPGDPVWLPGRCPRFNQRDPIRRRVKRTAKKAVSELNGVGG